MKRDSVFSRLATATSRFIGHPQAFIGAVVVVLLWLVSGPIFHWSDTWQLVINTGTTVITFLIVFLIQHSQNRDSIAMQLKLDELIRCSKGAHNALLDLEKLTERDLDAFRARYEALARRSREELREGVLDTDSPELEGENPGER